MSSSKEKEMFNADIKEQYISFVLSTADVKDIESYRRRYYNFFKRTAEIEKSFGKDLLDLDQNELIDFLGKFIKGGKEYQFSTLIFVKGYLRWGIENNFSTLNPTWLYELNLSDINVSLSYADSMVSSEQDLISILDTVLNPMSLDTKDNIVRLVCHLLFAGIQYDDIWFIRQKDVHLSERIISYRDRSIKISDDLYKIISYNLSMRFIMNRGIIREGYLISNSRQYLDNRNRMKRTYSTLISKKLSDCDRAVTNNNIYDSGVFYRIYLREKETGEIDCQEYLWARRNLDSTIIYPNQIEKRCLYEYTNWKRSFGLE